MINHIMKAFVTNPKLFKTMPQWLLMGQFREHQKQNYINSYVLNRLSLEDGLGAYAVFTKSRVLDFYPAFLI